MTTWSQLIRNPGLPWSSNECNCLYSATYQTLHDFTSACHPKAARGNKTLKNGTRPQIIFKDTRVSRIFTALHSYGSLFLLQNIETQGVHPAYRRSWTGVKRKGVTLTTDIHQVPWPRTGGDIPLRHIHAFIAQKGKSVFLSCTAGTVLKYRKGEDADLEVWGGGGCVILI